MQLGRARGARKAVFIYDRLTKDIETSRSAFQKEGFEIVDLLVDGRDDIVGLVEDDFEVVIVDRESLRTPHLISKVQAWRKAGHALVLLGDIDATCRQLRPHWVVGGNCDQKSLEIRVRQFVDTFHFVSKNLLV